ncbi:MAG: hypothetical protein UU76_C0013G0003 [Parcubacteria group bacterium GW2011_GWC1_41_7]|nr:MAG: hypothetical protein UU76_C0013G0003 [Parcubacteria group bacterium GW2011_GWC1_41_7]
MQNDSKEIKFKIRTLQHDLLEKQPEERTINTHPFVQSKMADLPIAPPEPSIEKIESHVSAENIGEIIDAPIPPQKQDGLSVEIRPPVNIESTPQEEETIPVQNISKQEALQPRSVFDIKQKNASPPLDTVVTFEGSQEKGFKFSSIVPVIVIVIIAVPILIGVFLTFSKSKNDQSEPLISQQPTEGNASDPLFSFGKKNDSFTSSTPETPLSPATTTHSPQSLSSATETISETLTHATSVRQKVLPQPKATTTPTITEEPKSPAVSSKITGTQKKIQPTPAQKATTETIWLFDFAKFSFPLSDLSSRAFQKTWGSFLSKQSYAGSISLASALFEDTVAPYEFMGSYFFKPSFIEEKYAQGFRSALGPHYEILFYYTLTRKFPIVVFQITDDTKVVPFMRLWDKESMLSDLSPIYRNLSSAPWVRKYFVTQSFEGIDYRIAYRSDDYKLIWAIYNDKLIVSTTLSGFKILVQKLKIVDPMQ